MEIDRMSFTVPPGTRIPILPEPSQNQQPSPGSSQGSSRAGGENASEGTERRMHLLLRNPATILRHGRLASDTGAYPQGEEQPRRAGKTERTFPTYARRHGGVGDRHDRRKSRSPRRGWALVHDRGAAFPARGLAQEGGRRAEPAGGG